MPENQNTIKKIKYCKGIPLCLYSAPETFELPLLVPTVKTVGYYRSAPLGRVGNSVPEGQAKIARSFKAGLGQHISASSCSGTGLISSVLVSASFIWHLLLQHVTSVVPACMHLKSMPACT